MKWCVVFVVLVISLANAEEYGERRGVLKRATRAAIGGMGGAFLVQTEKNIINNCKYNGLSQEGADKLQESFNDMKRCMSTPTIFSVGKDEYIQKMTSCSQNALSLTRDCLKQEQKYFPDFLLDLAKSLVSFMYDDKTILASRDVPLCMNNFLKLEVRTAYIDCMTSTAKQTNDNEFIPDSRAEMCRKFVPAGECFPKTLNQYCSHSGNVQKFTSDYSKALEQPCESKEF